MVTLQLKNLSASVGEVATIRQESIKTGI